MLITSTILWLGVFCQALGNTIPYSTSETMTQEGDDCIRLLLEPNQRFDCLLDISDRLPTYTLKSRFLEAYKIRSGQPVVAQAMEQLSQHYQQLAIRNPRQETDQLAKELEPLKQNREYVRLLNILIRYKNPELSGIRALMDHVIHKLEQYAHTQLLCKKYAHELIEAYTLLTQIYSLTDRIKEKRDITAEAIDLFIEHKAQDRYPLPFQYFQQQHQQTQNSIEKNSI